MDSLTAIIVALKTIPRAIMADAAAAPAPSLPCILALQPTSPAGSAWSEIRLPPLNYAAELAGQGYVVIAPD
jgi:hypothetical protein